MLLRKLVLFASALVAVAPATAQAVDQDVRCMMAGNVFAMAEKDPARKQLAIVTGLFFAGRADARLSPAQLKAAISAQGKALNATNAAATMNECARAFQAKQRALQAIGRELQSQQTPPKK